MDYSYPLLCSCERNRNRTALIGEDGEPITYSELERRIAGLAAGLSQLGVAGKSVASVLPNLPETVMLYMALARAGAVNVPVNTRLSTSEKQYIFENADATFLVAEGEHLPEAADLVAASERLSGLISVEPESGTVANLRQLGESTPAGPPADADGDDNALAMIIYTSGTTGLPKGVLRTHRANSWNQVNSALGAPRSHTDIELFNLPAFGIGFLHFLMPALLGGATVVMDRGFNPDRAWELLESHRATRTFLAPTMIDSMLEVDGHEQRDISSLETIYTAYTFPTRLRERALERFGDRFVGMYGLTEAQLTCDDSRVFEAKPTGVGRSMGVSRVGLFDSEGKQVAPGETGEIGFEGPAVMSGYHGLEEATREASAGDWILTGDLGSFDEDGDLHYVGRSKEMIKTGGFSVDPVEVENAILTIEQVREAAVIGVEDDHWGEAVVAFVSLEDASDIGEAEIVTTCKAEIAGYKAPKRVLVTEELPKNPTGKVERGKLRRLYAEQTG